MIVLECAICGVRRGRVPWLGRFIGLRKAVRETARHRHDWRRIDGGAS